MRGIGLPFCALCGVAPARGFYYQRPGGEAQKWHACSMQCLDGVKRLVDIGAMALKTEMERQAVRDARRQFAEALTRHGLMEPFFNQPGEVIDALIEAAIVGFQASMQRQSASGEIPY
jgi:hypothetical protein